MVFQKINIGELFSVIPTKENSEVETLNVTFFRANSLSYA